MFDFLDAIQREASRLQSSTSAEMQPQGMGTVRFIGHTDGRSYEVIKTAKDILQIINQNSQGDWPSDDDWRQLLPKWFVDACGPEMSAEETQEWLEWWRGLKEAEKVDVERTQRWTLDDWTYWLHPDNRVWFWWDAAELSEHDFVAAVETHEWPFPSGALQWLLRACGADRVDSDL